MGRAANIDKLNERALRKRLFPYNCAYYLGVWVASKHLARDPLLLPPDSAELTRAWIINHVWTRRTQPISVQRKYGPPSLVEDEAE